jgi:hypothetical protein
VWGAASQKEGKKRKKKGTLGEKTLFVAFWPSLRFTAFEQRAVWKMIDVET